MQPSLAVQIVWPLAARESIALEYEFIEPAHLLLALLKFAEQNDQQLEEALDDRRQGAMLCGERDSLRKALASADIKVPSQSSSLRYALRGRLGLGGAPYDGRRTMHRSSQAKQACERAMALARQSGARQWSTLELLTALLEQPPRELHGLMGDANDATEPGPDGSGPRPLWLAELGLDSSTRSAEPSGDPVCRVLLNDLERGGGGVCLIPAGGPAPAAVLAKLVGWIRPRPKAQGTGSLRADLVALTGVGAGPAQAELAQFLAQADDLGTALVFLGPWPGEDAPCQGRPLAAWLMKAKLAPGCLFVLALTQEEFNRCQAIDRGWARRFRPVWLHDASFPPRL